MPTELTQPPPDISKLRFLVVEDHGFQRWMAGNLLEKMGACHVLSAEDGNAALRFVNDFDSPIDVIISDLDMPGMDGMEFIRHLGELGSPASLIVFSSHAASLLSSVESMTKAYGVNLLGTIEKPATAASLAILIGQHRPAADGAARKPQSFAIEDVEAGLRAGEFEPFFQPQVNMATGVVRGVEALARWRHPRMGIVSPGSLISGLEENERLEPLTELILKRAAADCSAWRKHGLDAGVSVSLPLASLSGVGVADRMRQLVLAQDLEARHVTLQIADTEASHTGPVLENLSRLRMNGFGLAIDGYRIGYSTRQLTQIAFTELKIDQSFVRNADSNSSSRAMLESTLEMARKLDISAVAKGVETRAEWDLLVRLGCPAAQGDFISRPVESADFSKWARAAALRGGRGI